MQNLFNNAGFVALMGTVFGGAGLKIVESWIGRAKERADAGSEMRNELRRDIEGLRKQLENGEAEQRRLESLVEEWRAKYYDLLGEKQKVVTELTLVMDRLKGFEKALDSKTSN